MRHTFATWSLAAGMSIFTLARRMGTSVQMIDDTYGHLARDADDQDRELLNPFDEGNGHDVARIRARSRPRMLRRRRKPADLQGVPEGRGGRM
jgi:hypothetical protein